MQTFSKKFEPLVETLNVSVSVLSPRRQATLIETSHTNIVVAIVTTNRANPFAKKNNFSFLNHLN